jgi:A/G-specific adenine glycosylase
VKLHLALAWWRRKDKLLVARRPEGGLFGGLWELPAVERTRSEAALPEALTQALGAKVRLGEPLLSLRRTLTHRDLQLTLYPVTGKGTPRATGAFAEVKWLLPEEIFELGMSTAMWKALSLALALEGEAAVPS